MVLVQFYLQQHDVSLSPIYCFPQLTVSSMCRVLSLPPKFRSKSGYDCLSFMGKETTKRWNKKPFNNLFQNWGWWKLKYWVCQWFALMKISEAFSHDNDSHHLSWTWDVYHQFKILTQVVTRWFSKGSNVVNIRKWALANKYKQAITRIWRVVTFVQETINFGRDLWS